MSLATFGLVSDGMTVDVATPTNVNGGPRLPSVRLQALAGCRPQRSARVDLPLCQGSDRCLWADDGPWHRPYRRRDGRDADLRAAQHGSGRFMRRSICCTPVRDCGSWRCFSDLPRSPCRSSQEAAHVIWWSRRNARPRIRQNAPAQSADTIILVGSEGGTTWQFANDLACRAEQGGTSCPCGVDERHVPRL